MAWSRTDDLDSSVKEVGQVTFGLDGKAYVIDLGKVNAQKLRTALQPFLTVASAYGELPVPPDVPNSPTGQEARPAPRRRTGKTDGGKSGKAEKAADKATTREIRAWANQNGYAVGPMGRIPNEVLEAFNANA